MCHIIEFSSKFKPDQNLDITVKTQSHVNVKELNVYVTAKFDYLGVFIHEWGEFRPLKINVPFGNDQVPRIITQHYQQIPLRCKKSDPTYVSSHQCLVDYFISKEYSPCPYKVEGNFKSKSLLHFPSSLME